jgi:hypothetical protein
MKKIYKLH